MAATTPSTRTYESREAPPHEECGHPDWTLGCERCFWEMNQIAKGNIRAADHEAASEFMAEGAILMTWYHMLTVRDMEDQLAAKEAGTLDLALRSLCANLIANLRQLQMAMVMTIQDPVKLNKALSLAASIATKMKQQEPATPATTPTDAPAARKIALTDVA